MRITQLSIAVAGLLMIGVAGSYPRIAQARIEAKHRAIAEKRSETCFLLERGAQVQIGYNYAGLLDPSKKWNRVDAKGKTIGPTREGGLLAGVNQAVCDGRGLTAEIGPGGVAQNPISTSPDKMQELLKKRFPTGEVPFSVVAIQSELFKPDFSKRAAEAKAKAAKENQKIKF